MIKIKRISQEQDVTLEITAPKETWETVRTFLGQRQLDELPTTYKFYQALNAELSK